jgi:hypothetical protein
MKKLVLTAFILSLIVLNSLGQNQPDLRSDLESRLVGEWVNIDLNTGGLTKVIITKENNELLINAFGKCHPEDCELGVVKLHKIAASIEDDKNILPFDYLLATWHVEGKEPNAMIDIMKIIFETGPKPKLQIETITIFNDNSNREDYHRLEIMKKK